MLPVGPYTPNAGPELFSSCLWVPHIVCAPYGALIEWMDVGFLRPAGLHRAAHVLFG